MSSIERFRSGDPIPFEVLFTDINHLPITNAVGIVFIRRKSDNKYWSGTVWQTARASVSMTEINETTAPGWWKYDFDSSLGNSSDQYVIEIQDSSGNAANTPEPMFAYVGAYLDTIEVLLTRSIGLMYENAVLEPVLFQGDIMIEGLLRIYDSKQNAVNDDGSTGLVSIYNIQSPHVGNKLTKYTQTLEPTP